MGNVNWSEAFGVVFSGILVVFAVLLILVFFCWLLGKIMTVFTNRKDKPKAKKDKKNLEPVNAEPVVEKGISGNIVAAISAAIAAICGGNGFKLKSIKRSKGNRPVWNQQGIIENTRPF